MPGNDGSVRREGILRAAIQIFSEKGYRGASASEIAERAGVSHGTVFLHFGSKELLFRAAVLEPLTAFRDEVLAILGGTGSAAQRLRAFLREEVGAAGDASPALHLLNAAALSGDTSLATSIGELVDAVVEGVARVVKQGQVDGDVLPGDPLTMAVSCVAYLNGVGMTVPGASSDAWEGLLTQAERLILPPASREGMDP